jgi:prefoldin subunit 2
MSAQPEFDPENAEQVLGVYRQMQSECSQIMGKISELNLEKEEHKLVVETLKKVELERRAYRLVGGVLAERTVGDILPIVESNFVGIAEVLAKLDSTLKTKDEDRKAFKEKHGIMTQEERDSAMKRKVREAEITAAAGKAAAAKGKAKGAE